MSIPERQRFDLDAIRQRVSLSGLIGKRVKLRRTGRQWGGLCPFHREKTPSFTVNDDKGAYHCFGCGVHGSVFDWVMFVEGCEFAEAARILAEGRDLIGDPVFEQRVRVERPAVTVGSEVVAAWLWRTALPARGSIVERYLASRGLSANGVPNGLHRLRFHPRAAVVPWRVDAAEGDAAVRAPAMIAAMQDGDGRVGGVHATYLSADGSSKAQLRRRDGSAYPNRKMWGRLTGNAVWLTGSPPGDARFPLIVGEGIETVWAYVQSLDRSCRAAAALSLDNLQGYPATIDGVLPIWRPRIDADRPCFTVSDPGDVRILIDADMKPLRERRIQRRRGERWTLGSLSGADRAQLCATLAVQQWRRAGARSVDAVRPPAGMDFNDMVRGAA